LQFISVATSGKQVRREASKKVVVGRTSLRTQRLIVSDRDPAEVDCEEWPQHQLWIDDEVFLVNQFRIY
jgi:hypothetical protein